MSNEITDIKVTLARVTATLEHMGKIIDKHDKSHEEHEACCVSNRVDIASIRASGRTLKAVIGFLGLGGIAALIKGFTE